MSLLVPVTYAQSRNHKMLWAAMSYLDETASEAPFGHYEKTAVRKAVGRRQTIWEARIANRFLDYFEKEREQVAAAVERNASRASILKVLKRLEPELVEVLRSSFEDVAKVHYAWIVDHVRKRAAPKKKPTPFEQDVQTYLRRYSSQRVVDINATTRKLLRNILAQGELEGASGGEIARRIDDLYLDDIIPNRSQTIARTETGSAANYAGLEAAKDTGVGMKKEWSTNIDGRERPDHRAADGQQVDLDADFRVGGERLAYPGDMKGSAEQIINCRCFVLYHVV